ncbi:MAG: hypothetical protein ACTSRR_10320 [Candidatus Heimdallarchaeaceae archaeon]
MKKALYRSKFRLFCPVKLDVDSIILDLDFAGGKEFFIERSDIKGSNEYIGYITVAVEKPEMELGNTRIRFILQILLDFLSIEKIITKNSLFIDPPSLLNPDDFKNITKTGYRDVKVSASIAREITVCELCSLIRKLQIIDNIPSKELIYSLILSYAHFLKSDHNSKLVNGWKVLDLLIIQSLCSRAYNKNTIKLVKAFVNDIVQGRNSDKIYSNLETLIRELSNFNIEGRSNYRRDIELKKAIDGNSSVKKLQLTLLCIYEVRNIKLHQSKKHSAYGISVRLLEALLKEFWNIRINDIVGTDTIH